ncbi:MAG: hypothetical protein JSU64_00020 [candidate division WOR-3 bacterium]|nr:MAG: hypothetical protein JSU64_00020 [candidate division WOR-3 bacterium]
MTALLLTCLIGSSAFSIAGIGEDLSIFRMPFVRRDNVTRIGFTLSPEYALLSQSGEYRGVFWTNPFKISFSVPISHGFSLVLGNLERYNQCFDIYRQDSALQVHALGEGGIEEIYGGLNKQLGPFDVMVTGSFLFGNTWEIWTYNIGAYSLVDTFNYRYRGRIFSIGFRHNIFAVAYEGLGELRMVYIGEDTTVIELPQRLSIGIYPRIGEWPLGIVYERSFWQSDAWHDSTYCSPHRFKLMARRNAFGLAYYFNPWYIDGVSEHGIEVDFAVPLRNVGVANAKMGFAMRARDGLTEFKFVPKLTFVFNEIFARRRK